MVQGATGENVQPAYVDQRYTQQKPAADAAVPGVKLEMVKNPQARQEFVVLPLCWWRNPRLHRQPVFADWLVAAKDSRPLWPAIIGLLRP